MPLAQLVMYPAMAVTRQPPHAKIVQSIMNPQVRGRPVQSVRQARSLLKEIHLVHPVIHLAPLVSRLRPPASPATSTTSPQGPGQPAPPASWGLSPRSETPPAHPATYLVMVVMELPPRARTAQ